MSSKALQLCIMAMLLSEVWEARENLPRYTEIKTKIGPQVLHQLACLLHHRDLQVDTVFHSSKMQNTLFCFSLSFLPHACPLVRR